MDMKLSFLKKYSKYTKSKSVYFPSNNVYESVSFILTFNLL